MQRWTKLALAGIAKFRAQNVTLTPERRCPSVYRDGGGMRNTSDFPTESVAPKAGIRPESRTSKAVSACSGHNIPSAKPL